MPTIVRHIDDARRYVLVGTGYSKSESSQPHWLLGKLVHTLRTSDNPLVCICDEAGKLYWSDSDQIVVESIDGVSPADALQAYAGDAPN